MIFVFEYFLWLCRCWNKLKICLEYCGLKLILLFLILIWKNLCLVFSLVVDFFWLEVGVEEIEIIGGIFFFVYFMELLMRFMKIWLNWKVIFCIIGSFFVSMWVFFFFSGFCKFFKMDLRMRLRLMIFMLFCILLVCENVKRLLMSSCICVVEFWIWWK